MDLAYRRLTELLDIGQNSDMTEPRFERDKFLWVFGNLVQEYLADRLFEAGEHSNMAETRRTALGLAERWFRSKNDEDWPFRRAWLIKYLEGRFYGPRRGTSPEDSRQGGQKEFKRRNPKRNAKCNWYLGCPISDRLQVDHKTAHSLGAPSNADSYQWLCEKHNRLWKNNLLFWGCNFIPFKEYDEDDQPR
jgi:hypothetical protein